MCDRFTDATFAYQGGGRGIDPARMYKTLLFDLDGGVEKMALAALRSIPNTIDVLPMLQILCSLDYKFARQIESLQLNNHDDEVILAELEGQLSEQDAQEAFTTAVNWARYAELFSYDYDSGILSLESPSE